MSVTIKTVEKMSLCDKHGVLPGDVLISVNGHEIEDVLDYQFYVCDKKVKLQVKNQKGRIRNIRLRKKDEYDDIGLEFETYLMDKKHSCRNKCIFCFIDQLPKGMRESLYFKDDDERLSFFFGNYVTLTNMSQRDVDRIIEMHISPINVSVHTMNPELRCKMMNNRFAGQCLEIIKKLAAAGIEINTQLVLCPGINDGKELEYSLSELAKLYPSVNSIAAVPFGMTDYREGLAKIEPYTKETARKNVEIIENFSKDFYEKHGKHLAYASDEFYIQAEKEIPSYEFYEDFSQLENGIGMLALLRKEFSDALNDEDFKVPEKPIKITMATGVASYPYIKELAKMFENKFSTTKIEVVEIINDFFGHSITVSGLITGQDLIKQLQNRDLGDALIIPSAMLKGTYPQDDADDNVFLDDITLDQVQEKLNIKVIPINNDGYEMVEKLLEVEKI